MGILTRHGAGKAGPRRLPSGAFTVDAQANLVSSTVPQWIPDAWLVQIGQQVLAVFKGAATVHLPFTELRVHYSAFRITAREMRGGAIIFLSPKTVAPPPPSS
jgi:hypothetical protein